MKKQLETSLFKMLLDRPALKLTFSFCAFTDEGIAIIPSRMKITNCFFIKLMFKLNIEPIVCYVS